MDFLATTGCMDDEVNDDKKITLMEFLFGGESKPLIEIEDTDKGMSLSESKINVKLSYIDESPVESRELLVDILIKYMEDYSEEPAKSMSVTPSLSEKSKSDVTISKIETFSEISKTKSDSTLTHTQDTIIEKDNSRRISETVVDLSNVKQDLEEIFDEAVAKTYKFRNMELPEDDTMSETEDLENYAAYTKPILYNIYSVELSDILEEDENESSKVQDDKLTVIRECAEDLIEFIEDKIQRQFESDSSSDDFNINASLERCSISLIDLRSIPDLPPSLIRPVILKVDKSTSTDNDSVSDGRVDSACSTEDTALTSERQERALDKIESLHKFFSRSRLEIITESMEEERNDKRQLKKSDGKSSDLKAGQASLDDVEDIQDYVCDRDDDEKLGTASGTMESAEATNDDINETEAINKNSIENNTDGTNVIYQKLTEDNDSLGTEVKCVDNNELALKCLNKPIVTDFRETDSNITDVADGVRRSQNAEAKVVCQNGILELEYNERRGLNSEKDFTEIDNIISDAVKIILVNKLESLDKHTLI